MRKAFFSALNVRPDEQQAVALLLGKGFFMGIFLATYQVSAETLFLNRMVEYLKEGIVVSGFLGVITTWMFATLQGRVKFSRLAIGNLLLILLFTFAVYFLYQSSDSTIQDYLIFLMFAMIGPITAVILLGFWGTFGRLFDLRQSKRIIGRIDVGQLIAAIGSYLAIPLLVDVIPDTSSYLLISAISIGVALIFLVWLHLNADDVQATMNMKEQRQATRYSKLMRMKYVRLLSSFLIISMITFTFIQFSFQVGSAEQFPDETDLRSFVSVFTGAVLILGFLMQSFVNDRVISEYGLKVALLILPIIVGVFTIAAITVYYFFNWGLIEDNIYFFLFIALSRLFNWSIRDSLENPTFKLYFMPFNIDVRFNIQTKVEGVINESARLLAGLLIFGLFTLPFITIIHISIAVLVLVAGYFIVVQKLYKGYRTMIAEKLESQQREASPETVMTLNEQMVVRMNQFLKSQLESISIFAFKLLEKIHPQVIPHSINVLMSHNTPGIRQFAQSKMNELKGTSVSDKYILANHSEPNGKIIISQDDLDELFKFGEISRNRVYKLSKSTVVEDRQYAAEIIGNYAAQDKTHYLVDLLFDKDPVVRRTAIKTASKKYNWEVLIALIDNLTNPVYSINAANALVNIGEDSLAALDATFYKHVNNYALMLKIIKIIGRIGGKQAIEHLWNKIDFPHKLVVSEVLVALGNCGFKASLTQIPQIKYAIESDIEAVVWNMGAYDEVEPTHFGYEIKNAIREEVDHDISHIYMLLSMLYDSGNINLVKENIESGTSEGLTYAIELLDVFLSDDLKKRIIPVLDDLTFQEKAGKLEEFYPRKSLNNVDVLKFLLNRDSTQTNRWTKACVLHQIGSRKLATLEMDVIANLFNPDQMVREVAAWALCQINPEDFDRHISRLGDKEGTELRELISNDEDDMLHFRFQQVRFLKSTDLFSEIHGVMISDICDVTDTIEVMPGRNLSFMPDFDQSFLIVREGMVHQSNGSEVLRSFEKGDFLGESLSAELSGKEYEAGETGAILYVINKEFFYEWLSDNLSSAREMTSQLTV